jgi:hypothetical protein
MNIVKCLKCGREFTQHFPDSSYWIKKQWCPICREEEETESKKIDTDYITERRKAMDSLSGFASKPEPEIAAARPEPEPEPEPSYIGGGGSFGGGGASASWEPEPSSPSSSSSSSEPSSSPDFSDVSSGSSSTGD